jgi:hypothetical protein
MIDPERDDDRPGGDDTFDIEIEGFDNLNFREEETPEPDYQSQEMDLELERIIRRLDEVTSPVGTGSLNVPGPAAQPHDSRLPEDSALLPIPKAPPPIPRAPVSRPPLVARPPEPAESVPQVESGTILLTERLDKEEPGAEPAKSLAGSGTIAQMTPRELAELIERAVEKGVRRALAASRS